MKKGRVVVGVVLLGMAVGGVAHAEVGSLRLVKGEVTVAAPGEKPVAAAKGAGVDPGWVISTGEQSYAVLRFDDGQVVTVGADSTMVIDEYHYSPEKPAEGRSLLSILKGGLRFISGKLGGSNPEAIRFRTAHATMGIRGTDFMKVAVATPEQIEAQWGVEIVDVKGKPVASGPEPKPEEVGTYVAVTKGDVTVTTEEGTVAIAEQEYGVTRSAGEGFAVVCAQDLPAAATTRFRAIDKVPLENLVEGKDFETLEMAVKKAVETHPDLLADAAERRAREGELWQARSGWLPRLDVLMGVGKEWSDNPTTRTDLYPGRDRTLTRKEFSIQARQNLFDGFGTKNEVARQRARIDSQAFRIQGTSNNVALSAADVYLELLRRQQLVALAKVNFEAHQRTYDQIATRVKQGVSRQADLDQVEGRLALAHSNLLAEEANLLDAETNYQRVMGELPTATLVEPALEPGVLPTEMAQAVDHAVANHPTLKSAEADVEAAMAQHRAAKHNHYPRFDLEAESNLNDNHNGVAGTDEDMLVMVRMRWNLYNGGRDEARRDQTAHLIDEAKEVRNSTRRQVVESIRLSWNAYRATDRQLSYLERHMKSSEAARVAYRKQFNIGQRTLLDLLDSENEVFESSRAYTESYYERLYAQYRVLAGMGELACYLGLLPAEESRDLRTLPWEDD